MARSKKKSFLENWQENYAGLILGAIIVVILGLLVANFITNKGQDIGNGEQITQEEMEEQKAQQEQEYTVAENDSLSKISEKIYGSQDYWTVIARENKITNPNVIWVGAKLKLPGKSQAETIKADLTATSYNVASGDTLFIIAEKMYGNGNMWPTIAKANKVGRLPNGNPLIFAESTLTIPR